MVCDPLLFCDAAWFSPKEVRSFPVAGYLDVNDMLPELYLLTIFYKSSRSAVARYLS